MAIKFKNPILNFELFEISVLHGSSGSKSTPNGMWYWYGWYRVIRLTMIYFKKFSWRYVRRRKLVGTRNRKWIRNCFWTLNSKSWFKMWNCSKFAFCGNHSSANLSQIVGAIDTVDSALYNLGPCILKSIVDGMCDVAKFWKHEIEN